MDSTPKLYLFLSVDVINSTKMKYRPNNSDFDWISEISNFYEEFPIELNTSIDSLKAHYKLKNKDQVHIWKYSGDEILFYYPITEEKQIPEIIEAFATTLVTMAEDSKKQLEFKGTAWTGQVPYLDIEFEKAL